MSLPYFPLYPKDYEAKTAHLSMLEDGAYNRLLRLCWMTPGCSLPNDEAWIMRRLRAHTDEERAAVLVVLDEFFTTDKDRVFQERLSKEAMLADAAHSRRVAAGRKGGQKPKPLETNETAPSNASAKPKQPEPEPYREKGDTNVSPQKRRGARLDVGWVLPREWGQWAVSEGWPEATVRLEAEKFKDHWISKSGRDAAKLDWQATWRNWMRNSKSPKIINGGQSDQPSKQSERLNAFIAGARGTP